MISSGLAHFAAPALAAEKHEAEFVNGQLVLSPSSLDTFLGCPRQWHDRYVQGHRDGDYASAEAGKRMHTTLELYYTRGVVPDSSTPEGEWALALIAKTNLPLPGAPMAERRFKFEHDRVWWRGSKDLTYDRDGVRIIRDHKSTSKLNPAWVKTEEKLRTDPQAVIYAFEEYLSQRPASVRCEWGYVTRTKYPQTLVSAVDMPYDATLAAMAQHTVTAKRMLQIYADKPEMNSLPPDGTHTGRCEAFGGCKVKNCNVTALDRIKGLQVFNALKRATAQEDDMGLLDKLREEQAKKAALGGAETPTAPVAGPTAREKLAAAAVTDVPTSVAPPPFVPAALPTPPPVEVATAVPPVGAPPVKRGRGRPAGVTTTVLQAAPVVASLAAATVVPPPPPRAYDVPQAGFELCVNCAPSEPYILFSKFVAVVHQALKETKGWDHYALFGFEGTAAYQDCLRQVLEQDVPSGILVVESSTNEGRDAMPILERAAFRVTRGWR